MRWGFWYTATTRQAGWAAGIVFTILGLLIVFAVPPLFASDPDAVTMRRVLEVFGGVVLVLGIAALLWMLGDLVLKLTGSPRRAAWLWWGNFALGVAGTLSFAIPSVLVLPAMLFLPDLFAGQDVTRDLWLGVLFFVVGGITLIALLILGRMKLRERP